MIQVHVKKGYSPRISGWVTQELHRASAPYKVALLPEKIPFIKPRLLLKKGDRVKQGTPVIEDKRHPAIRFLSPGGGWIEAVNLGPRRIIKEVVIALAKDEESETFDRIGAGDLNRMTRDEVVSAIIKGGLWPFFRELPFRDYPLPETTPPAIIVNLDKPEMDSPMAEVWLSLSGHSDLFLYGLEIAAKLTNNVFVVSHRSEKNLSGEISGVITHRITGAYPAADPGVLLYHTKKNSLENHSWYIDGQSLLLLASLFQKGEYPVERVFSVAGGVSRFHRHVLSRAGAPLSRISEAKPDQVRHIAGGIFNGYILPSESYMGFFETSLSLLPPGDEDEFFGFIRAGFKKPSHSRTFLSYFNRGPLDVDCGIHGDPRPCINCGKCAAVCQVDILPQFTFKCLVADEIEEALAHGLLDCVECGLCTYVCPSKIELAQTLINARAQYHREHVES